MITLTQQQKWVVKKYHSGAKQDNNLPFFFIFVALRPNAGHGVLILEVL